MRRRPRNKDFNTGRRERLLLYKEGNGRRVSDAPFVSSFLSPSMRRPRNKDFNTGRRERLLLYKEGNGRRVSDAPFVSSFLSPSMTCFEGENALVQTIGQSCKWFELSLLYSLSTEGDGLPSVGFRTEKLVELVRSHEIVAHGGEPILHVLKIHERLVRSESSGMVLDGGVVLEESQVT
jgi:hypothetical protein